MKGFFVTGIGTDVGKTVVAAILSKYFEASYWKPIQCGDLPTRDSLRLKSLVPEVTLHPETYLLSLPASPHAAALAEHRRIELDKILLPGANAIIVEGAGGVLVPLSEHHLMIDLIAKLKLPVIVVSKHYLGSINHTLLTAQALHARRLPVAGIVFLGESLPPTEEAIATFSATKILGRVPWTPVLDQNFITSEAKRSWLHELC